MCWALVRAGPPQQLLSSLVPAEEGSLGFILLGDHVDYEVCQIQGHTENELGKVAVETSVSPSPKMKEE